jgi:hypothetical protein
MAAEAHTTVSRKTSGASVSKSWAWPGRDLFLEPFLVNVGRRSRLRSAHTRASRAKAVFASLAFSAIASCSSVPEPGTPPRESTPLYDGYTSYRPLDEVQKELPDRSSWQVLSDAKIPARGPCPRFDELTFTIPASHLGYKGQLQLTFINQRLKATSFAPDDFASYVEALRRSGISFDAEGRATGRPATRIWQWELGRRFVGWADIRFEAQTAAWTSRCS